MEEHIEAMPEERRTMFKDYVQHISGHEIQHMAILHDFETREIPEIIREEMELAKQKAMEQIEQRIKGFKFDQAKQMFFKHLEEGSIFRIFKRMFKR
jgi:peptidoglycan/xylan/chitin deacetylase (PgdA/CDA1 family)